MGKNKGVQFHTQKKKSSLALPVLIPQYSSIECNIILFFHLSMYSICEAGDSLQWLNQFWSSTDTSIGERILTYSPPWGVLRSRFLPLFMLQEPLLNMGWSSEVLAPKMCFILWLKTANTKRLFEGLGDF